MKAQRAIGILLAIVAAIALIAGYKLYLQPQLDAFKKSKEQLQSMETKLKQLHEKFCSTVPGELESMWRREIVPWTEALDARSYQFGKIEESEPETVPEGRMPKIFYGQRYEAIMQELYQEASEARLVLAINPVESFGVDEPMLDSMTAERVEESLTRLHLGCGMARLLMESDPVRIDRVDLWPTRSEYPLEIQTVGFIFAMRLSDLVKFINTLSDREQFSRIDHIRISNANLLASSDPELNVEILFSQGRFHEAALAKFNAEEVLAQLDAEGQSAMDSLLRLKAQGGGGFGGGRRRRAPTWWQKFRKKYLPF